jgi:hypothetical protein
MPSGKGSKYGYDEPDYTNQDGRPTQKAWKNFLPDD